MDVYFVGANYIKYSLRKLIPCKMSAKISIDINACAHTLFPCISLDCNSHLETCKRVAATDFRVI